MKKIALTLLIIFTCIEASSQSKIVKDFKDACDSLGTLMNERTGVNGRITLKAVMKRGPVLDFYFTESLGDYPFRPGDAKRFRSALKGQFPDAYRNYSLGEVKSRNIDIENLEVAALTFKGNPAHSSHRTDAPKTPAQVVRALDRQKYTKGLDGRTIAVWQSHGRAFSSGSGLWEWHRRRF